MLEMESKDYKKISDLDWYNILSSDDEKYVQAKNWFFGTKCYSTVVYFNDYIMRESNPGNLYGLFFDFVIYKEWYVIKTYKGLNKATLETWLRKCGCHYFRKIKKQVDLQKKKSLLSSENIDKYISIEMKEDAYLSMMDECMHSTNNDNSDEEMYNSKIYKALNRLNERDQMVIKLLVIENNKPMDVAEELFAYRRGGLALESMTPKQIQDTIAILKKRACAKLLLEFQKMK